MFSKPAIEAQRGPYVKPAITAVRRLRMSRGLTQPECARLAGVGLRTLQRIEVGDYVDRHTVRKVERALGLPW